MKKLLAGLLVCALLLTGCAQQTDEPNPETPTTAPIEGSVTTPTTEPTVEPSTEPTTQPSTEPSTEPSTDPSDPVPPTVPPTDPPTQPTDPPVEPDDGMLEYEGQKYASFGEIVEKLEQQGQLALSEHSVQIGGLVSPVTLQMEYARVVSITAFGRTQEVAAQAPDYSFVSGNGAAALYDYQDAIILNIWHGNIGYSCAMTAQGTTAEYPAEGISRMFYRDDSGELRWVQTACKFNAIEDRWATAPVDLAVSREEFYYSEGTAILENGTVRMDEGTAYTICDAFDLDQIFSNAKMNGQYPDYETVDELLVCNQQAEAPAEDDPAGYRIHRVYDEGGKLTMRLEYYRGHRLTTYEYDDRGNLVRKIGYQIYGEHFCYEYAYDDQGREIAASCYFYGDLKDYRYTKSYDTAGNLIEKVYFEDDKENQRFTYAYFASGSRSETFYQSGERKYTYFFDSKGELVGQTLYWDGVAHATEDVTGLVKVQLVTDAWIPILDNEPKHFHFRHDGAEPVPDPVEGEITYHDDGSWSLIHGSIDEEDGLYYESERLYDANNRLIQEVYRTAGEETSRFTYSYDAGGNMVQSVHYKEGQEYCRTVRQFDDAGRLIKSTTSYTEEEGYYCYVPNEQGEQIWTYVGFMESACEYFYNEKGWLIEAVSYQDGKENNRVTYAYDDAGRLLFQWDYYRYIYDADGMLSRVQIVYDEWAAGDVIFHYRTVYVTEQTAEALRQNLNKVLEFLA